MYLIDTHALIWYVTGSGLLSEGARSCMENKKCFYSIVSLWEIAIKQSLKKLDFPVEIPYLESVLNNEGFEQIGITSHDIERIKELPFIHHDPFDRLLIAQAQENDLTLITKDLIIPKYDIKVLW